MNKDLNITAPQDALEAEAQADLVDGYFAAMAAGRAATEAEYLAYRQYADAGRYPTGDEIDEAREDRCGICGEGADGEMGEFWDKAKGDSVIAHAQCGLGRGLPMA